MLEASSAFIRDGLFNVSHWIFSFQYYSTAYGMHYFLSKNEMSEYTVKFNKALQITMIILNTLVPLVYSICLFEYKKTIYQKYEIPNVWSLPFIITKYSVEAFQIISGIFLGYAIFKIRQLLVQYGELDVIKIKVLIVHSLSFSLYILSIIVFSVFSFILLLKENPTNRINYYWANIISAVFSFLSQACLCGILW